MTIDARSLLFMDWLPLIDPVHAWDWVLAQVPTSPVPTPTPTPVKPLEVELLKSQLEFLKEANNRLSDSFSKFIEAMKYTLLMFGLLGGFLTFVFGKNLDDARKVASQTIRQEVEASVAAQVREAVQDEVENVKRVLGRERIVGSINVDYFLPLGSSEPEEFRLLEGRGFRQVRFRNLTDRAPLAADVVVLDLVQAGVMSGSGFEGLAEAEAEELRQARAAEWIGQVCDRLGQTSVLVVYVRPGRQRVGAVDELAQRVRFYASANTPVTLMGVVTDSAYVAYGWRNAGR